MGEVYRAFDERLAREVAVKILAGDLAATAEHLRRFEQEARAASALNHPNIITIYDIGRSEELSYIAMELIEGRDLRSMISGARLSVKQLLRIAVKVADGLAAAHDRGIVHRDLKPENLMVSRDGFLKILDFGLAKLVRPFTETDTTLPQTVPGAVFGTVGYMSPEQARGSVIDYRSDQFAFGVILYEMLTGHLPFAGASAPETLAAIIRDDPPPISGAHQTTPPELVRIVMRCLAKDPEERYASTRDLARDLREVRDRLSSASSSPRHRTGGEALSVVRRAPFWIGGAGLIALLVGGVVMVRRHNDAPTPAAAVSKVLAVVPFRDLSGTSEGRIFSDGISEMIRTRLVEAKGLRVIAPFEGAETEAEALDAAKRSGATILLRGGVQRQGDGVRVMFNVLEAGSGRQLANRTLEGKVAELFMLEDQVAHQVLNLLGLAPSGGPQRNLPSAQVGAADQKAYVEAVGLLQRPKDEKSVDRAIATLDALLLNARDSAGVNAMLARALYYKSQLSRRPALVDQAVVYAERASEIDPDMPEVHFTLGQLRLAAGRHEEAAAEFQKALAVRPNMPDAVLGLARVYEAMGRGADAEALYKNAVSLHSAGVFNTYGSFCYNRGRYQDAVRLYKQATEASPDGRQGFANLGAAYQALGHYDEALAAYQRSISIEPNSASYSNLGTVYYMLGRYDEACTAYEHATALAPTDYLVWANLGDAYRWAPGRREEAAGAYAKALVNARGALAVNPRDALVHAVIASSLAKSGRLTDADGAIALALKIDPTNPNVLYQTALVNVLQGSHDKALTWLQRAIAAGYPAGAAARDPEFGSLRHDPAFEAAVDPTKRSS